MSVTATVRPYCYNQTLLDNLQEIVLPGSRLEFGAIEPDDIYQIVEVLLRGGQVRAAALILALSDVLAEVQTAMTALIADAYGGSLRDLDDVRETYLRVCRFTGEKSEFGENVEDEDGEEAEGDDLCDNCLSSGVPISQTCPCGKTLCADCAAENDGFCSDCADHDKEEDDEDAEAIP